MDIVSIGIVVLCLAGAVAFVALAYLLFVLVKTIKEMVGKINPLLDDTSEMVEKLKPVVDKVDPMMDRVTLTIDAANLEIMRVDDILQDVGTVAGNLADATNKVETVYSAPLSAVGNVAGKLRSTVQPFAASDCSVSSKIASAVSTGLTSVETVVAEKQAETAAKRVVIDETNAQRRGERAKVNTSATDLKEGVLSQIGEDTDEA